MEIEKTEFGFKATPKQIKEEIGNKEISLKDLGYKKLKTVINEIVFENDMKYITFYKERHQISMTSKYGFSACLNIVEIAAIYNEMKGMNW